LKKQTLFETNTFNVSQALLLNEPFWELRFGSYVGFYLGAMEQRIFV
jgi:hypothetical protein